MSRTKSFVRSRAALPRRVGSRSSHRPALRVREKNQPFANPCLAPLGPLRRRCADPKRLTNPPDETSHQAHSHTPPALSSAYPEMFKRWTVCIGCPQRKTDQPPVLGRTLLRPVPVECWRDVPLALPLIDPARNVECLPWASRQDLHSVKPPRMRDRMSALPTFGVLRAPATVEATVASVTRSAQGGHAYSRSAGASVESERGGWVTRGSAGGGSRRVWYGRPVAIASASSS
jgi:hypothetical protein